MIQRFVAFEGDVAPPFFGAALAADYRFGTDEMVFQPSHLKLGYPPSGGIGFFLPRFVSHAKARDLLSIMGVKTIIQPHQKDLNAFLNYEDKAMAGVMARRKFHKG